MACLANGGRCMQSVAAAARFLRAQALEDAADELARLQQISITSSMDCTPEEQADYWTYAEHDSDHSAWLRARARRVKED